MIGGNVPPVAGNVPGVGGNVPKGGGVPGKRGLQWFKKYKRGVPGTFFVF
jgi:hypothetical protein